MGLAGDADFAVRGAAGRRDVGDVLLLVVLAGPAGAGAAAADSAASVGDSEAVPEACGELARPPDSGPLTCGASGAG
ncbi:hypothetical protein [Streptomyces sp. 8K308]|uniref:hypothetical protein n=1 Tax=Streptomyces sp. 8K308 TaxID=2530388 RepID=UPI001FB7A6F1|nr:hypothetical protein [Streptomyces sp. 8K308]